ncbi:toll-like receptor 5 [Lampetra fluviatilis]
MRSVRAARPRAQNHHHHHQLLVLVVAVVMGRTSACWLKPHSGYVSCINMNLTEPPPRDFLPANTTNLDISFNNILHLSRTSLPPLGYLQVLLLGRQHQGLGPVVVEDLAFAELPQLRWLDLGGNGLLVLQPRALWGLHRLEKLQMDYNGLKNEVLEGDFFRDLTSLRELDLTGNSLRRARLSRVFLSMVALRVLKLRRNTDLKSLCEGDLAAISGLHLELLDLSDTRMFQDTAFNWTECGNPLRNLSFDLLDISSTTFDPSSLQHFLESIRGVPIKKLNLCFLPNIGRSFAFMNFKDPVREWFLGLEKSGVEVLDFSRNRVFSLHPRVFSAFPAVHSLDLSRNKVNEIAPGAFQGLESLVLLNLSYNLLGEIYERSFKDLVNSPLGNVDLSHNHIGIIQDTAFAGFPKLTILDLRDNSILQLPQLKLPSLSYLMLGDNRLSNLYGLQTMEKSLVFLDVRRNRLHNLGEVWRAMALPRVQFLLFADNFLRECPPEATSWSPNNSLVYLDISGNTMEAVWASGHCMDMFHTLGALQKLFLDRNLLTALPDGLFLGLSSLLTLNLSNNHLSSVSAASLEPLRSLEVLDLAWNRLVVLDPMALGPLALLQLLDLRGNPFHCTCTLMPLLAWLNSSASAAVASFPDALRCASPSELQAVPLALLDSQGCEEEDLQLVRRLRLSLLCASSSAVLLLLVAMLGHRCCRRRFYQGLARLRELLLTWEWGATPKANEKRGGGAEFYYDAFVCHSEADFPWVRSELLRRLDSRGGRDGPLSVCLEARDFVPGEAHMDNLVRAVDASRCTLCVLTRRFLADSWCMEALRLAQGRGGALGTRQDVLVLLLGSLPEFQLQRHRPVRAHLQAGRPCVRWPEDPQDRDWCADLLLAMIREGVSCEGPQGGTRFRMRSLRPAGPPT